MAKPAIRAVAYPGPRLSASAQGGDDGSIGAAPSPTSDLQLRAPADAIASAVLKALPAAVLAVDDRGIIRFANDRAAEILGTQATELQDATLSHWLGNLPLVFPKGRNAARHSWELKLADGRRITIGYGLSHVQGEHGVLTALVFQDVSQEAALLAERDRLLRIATIGEALPSLLHELKNPLAAVRASVELMIEDSADPAMQEQLHAVLSEVRRMELGFDGISAVDRPLRCERHSAVDYACRQACKVMESRARNAGVHFRATIGDMPLLPLDAGVLRALILNFVTNALHATERDGAITLNAWYDASTQRFELRVVDTGTGMKPEVLARATELFFSTKKSGSGIGLALCKRGIEAAGGELLIESVPGVGTAVSVTVPTNELSPRSA